MASIHVIRVGLSLLTVALVAAAPAGVQQQVPEVDTSTVWVGEVQRGELVRQVRGPGTLERFGRGFHAHVRVAAFHAGEVELGQPALIDTRAEKLRGEVVDIDDRIQQGTLGIVVEITDEVAASARPGLSVDGRIEVERLHDVVYLDRPAFGQADQTVGLFRLGADGTTAERVPVTFGASSVDKIVIVDGLAVGDRIILSDMSRYDAADRIRLVN